MQIFVRLTALGLLLSLSTLFATEPVINTTNSPENAVLVTIIYDNYQDDTSLETDWGFACLVEYQGEKLLFDAGRKIDLYRKNVNKLKIKPEQIPSLFISHEHGDHTAGIPWITEINPSVKCYLPASYEAHLRDKKRLPPNSLGLSNPSHLYGPFYSTGDNFESFKEQGLIIKTEDGGVLISGCGHPGIVEMVSAAREDLGIKVHTVIGGLHLMRTSGEDVKNIVATLQKMGIKQICPTHCTGDSSIAIFKESFNDGYLHGGTGRILVIE